MALTTAADVYKMLRWGSAEQTKYSADIAGYITAAAQIIENEAGPFEPRTVVHTTDGGPSVVLPYRVNEIASVVVDGVAADYTADLGAGIVYGPFASGRQNVIVTFTTGYTPIPPAVAWAATSLVAHMWSIASQRGPGLPEDYTAVPTGFLVPNVVKEALAPFKTMPGFA